MDIAIHTNFALSHQRQHAELFRKGFERHGIKSNVTCNVIEKADIHIVMGPHYAKNYYLTHPNVILLDRCYYKGNENHVSVGWMNSIGGRCFVPGHGKESLTIKESTGSKSLFLVDYNGIVEDSNIVRYHPSNKKSTTTLLQDIKECNSATGYNTTSLVIAALNGLDITCKGNVNILLNANWLDLLPYADWSYDEIESGELWDHLKLSQNQLANL